MNPPDAFVTIEGGVADVSVRTPGLVIEVRDYDVNGVDEDLLWTDENGDECVRYFASQDDAGDPP
jgi:hypothetical protein